MWDCAARAKCFDTIGLAGLNISLADTPSTLVSRLPMATSQLQHPGDGSESHRGPPSTCPGLDYPATALGPAMGLTCARRHYWQYVRGIRIQYVVSKLILAASCQTEPAVLSRKDGGDKKQKPPQLMATPFG